jgi:hypothetical protein
VHLIIHFFKNLHSFQTPLQQCQKWQNEIQMQTGLLMLKACIKVHTTLSCLWTSHIYNILALVPSMKKYMYSSLRTSIVHCKKSRWCQGKKRHMQMWRFHEYCVYYTYNIFVVKFYIIYLLFVLFRYKKSHNFEINIHNLLFLIKISVLIKSFKGQNLTVPQSSYYQCCKIDHVQRNS